VHPQRATNNRGESKTRVRFAQICVCSEYSSSLSFSYLIPSRVAIYRRAVPYATTGLLPHSVGIGSSVKTLEKAQSNKMRYRSKVYQQHLSSRRSGTYSLLAHLALPTDQAIPKSWSTFQADERRGMRVRSIRYHSADTVILFQRQSALTNSQYDPFLALPKGTR